MNAQTLLVPILLFATNALGCAGSEYECPSGWEGNASNRNGSLCSATDAHLAGLRESHDQAVVGFVEKIEGGGGPGDDSCVVTFIEDHEIAALA